MACLMTLCQLYWFCDVKCKGYCGLQIWTNLIRPILTYGSETWTTTTGKLTHSAYLEGKLQEKYVDP